MLLEHLWSMNRLILIVLLGLMVSSTFSAVLKVWISDQISMDFYIHTKNPNKIKKYLKTHLKDVKSIEYNQLPGDLYDFYIVLNKYTKNFTYNVSPFLKVSNNNTTYEITNDFWIKILKEDPKPGKLTKDKINIVFETNTIYGILPILLELLVNLVVIGLYYWARSKYRGDMDYQEKIKYKKFLSRVSIIFLVIWLVCLIIFLVFGTMGFLSFMIKNDIIAFVVFLIIFFLPWAIYFILFSNLFTRFYTGKKNVSGKKAGIYSFISFMNIVFAIILSDVLFNFIPSSVLNKLGTIGSFLLGFFMVFAMVILFDMFVTYDLLPKLLKAIEPADDWLVQMVEEVSREMGVKKPKKVYVIKEDLNPTMNAMYVGLFKKTVFVTERLLKTLNKDEIKSVLAHELGHKKSKHVEKNLVIFMTIAIAICFVDFYIINYIESKFLTLSPSFVAIIIFLTIIPIFVIEYILTYKRTKKSEFEADFWAARITGPKTYIKALAKLAMSNYIPMDYKDFISSHPNFHKRFMAIAKEFGLSEEEIEKLVLEAKEELV